MRFSRRQPRPFYRRKRFWLSGIILAAIGVWWWGFWQFAESAQNQVVDTHTRTQAMVVLTGGPGRVQASVDLLTAGLADKLLITGVDPAVASIGEMGLRLPPGFKPECCIELGKRAQDTYGNAIEAAQWVQAHRFRSLRLVTASYHMPRAMLEFRRLLPGVVIIPHPLPHNSGKIRADGTRLPDWQLLLREYHKYWLIYLGHQYLSKYM